MSRGKIRVLDVKGSKELLQKLQKLKAAVRGPLVEQALMKGGYIVEAHAKNIVPVRTGNLKNSIQTQPGRNDGHVVEVEVSTNVEYAPHVEFGTRDQAAQPFMRPAADNEAERVSAAVSGELKRLIDGVV